MALEMAARHSLDTLPMQLYMKTLIATVIGLSQGSGLRSIINTRPSPSLLRSQPCSRFSSLVVMSDDMLPDLVLQHWLLLMVQQLVNEIGFVVDQLQAQMAAKLVRPALPGSTYQSFDHF